MVRRLALELFVCFFSFGLLLGLSAVPTLVYATKDTSSGTPVPQYQTAVVTNIIEQTRLPDEPPRYTQVVTAQLKTGEEITLQVGNEYQPINESQLVKIGMTVVVASEPAQLISEDATASAVTASRWVLTDIYRLPVVVAMLALFVVAVLIVGRWQGLFSLLGMTFSLTVLLSFTVPRIVSGENPVAVSIITSLLIASVTVYLSHGWSKKTHVALVSLLASLSFVAVISIIAVQLANLVGLGSEEAFFLNYGSNSKINLQGLLLGGIILGALGVLDDITVAQSAVVFQLAAAKQKITRRELFERGMVVGRDHVASLVNTLVLAYVGANMALFLLFYLNEQTPHWVALNGEMIVEEIIRTLAGSLGLVLAVPITTLCATWVAKRWLVKGDTHASDHGHDH